MKSAIFNCLNPKLLTHSMSYLPFVINPKFPLENFPLLLLTFSLPHGIYQLLWAFNLPSIVINMPTAHQLPQGPPRVPGPFVVAIGPLRSLVSVAQIRFVQLDVAPIAQPTPHVDKMKCVDYAKIINWLEVPENFAQLTSKGRKTKIGGNYPSKKTIFKKMLTLLHDHGFPKGISIGENLKKQYD